MKSIKRLLFGIAFLILACVGAVLGQGNIAVGEVMPILFSIIGMTLCIVGYFEWEE